MFGRKKERQKEKRENERMVRKVLGKDSGRRVFGFQCLPNLQATIKSLADQIHVPLFALIEHAIELGEIQIVDAMKDPEECELLRRHLVDFHIAPRTSEKIARYDEEVANDLRMERIRRFGIEKATRQLVMKFVSWGHKPEELEQLILLGNRCRWGITQGWPVPPDIPQGKHPQRPTNNVQKTNLGETEKGSEDDSTGQS